MPWGPNTKGIEGISLTEGRFPSTGEKGGGGEVTGDPVP